eukprot:EG_transcript_15429
MKLLNLITVLVVACNYASIFLDAASIKLPGLPGLSLLDALYACFVTVFFLQSIYTPKSFDLVEQFSFYSSYHVNAINKLIHVCFVWPILWTALVMFVDTAPLPLPAPLPGSVPWGPVALAAGTALYHVCLDRTSGPVSALLAALCLVTSQMFAAHMGPRAVPVACAIHAFAWVWQFVGHGVFEGRAPSLLDNLAQSFLMAPHFVLLEVTFELGLRKDLYAKAHQRTLGRIKEFKEASRAH